MSYRPYLFQWTLLLTCIWSSLYSQSYWQGGPFRFENITVEKGLPTPAVIDIFRDVRGFIWFYTSREIIRFDGFDYRRYPIAYHPLDVIRFGDDEQGTLYTTDGLNLFRYDAVTDRFFPIPLPEPSGSKEALCFLPTTLPGPRCWFRHGDRLYKLSSTKKKPTLVTDQLQPSDRYVGLVNQNGEILFSNANVGTQTSTLQRIRPDGTILLGPGIPAMIHQILEDLDGNFWMATQATGLWCFHPDSKQLRNYTGFTQQDNALDFVLPTKWTGEDILWCNYGSSGLCLFNRTKGRPEVMLRANEFQKQALISTNIYKFHYDRQHILWLGTEYGVSMLHPGKQRVRQLYFHQPTDDYLTLPIVSLKPGLAEERFMLFCEDNIRVYDPKGKTWRTINKASNGLREQKSGHYFRACFDAEGQLWLATPNGLFSVNRQKGSVIRKVAGLAGKEWAFGAICPDKMGNIWWYDRYLRRYNPKSGKEETILDSRDTSELMPYEGLLGIQPAEAGGLWLTGLKTVVRFDPASLKVIERHHLSIPAAAKKFHPRINRIVIAGDTLLWLATTYGLAKIDLRTHKQTNYYPQGDSTLIFDGLGLALDRFGNVWCGDHHVIYRIDRNTGHLITIDQRDGCSSNPLYDLVVNGDRILANRYRGVVDEINPDIFQTPQPALAIYITDVFFGEQRLAINPDSTMYKPYRFLKRDQAISISYTAIDFDQPHKVRFEYRLEPYDHTWVHAGKDRSATYTNLEGGQYRFQVRVVNADGVVSELAEPLCFYVPPIWYRTWWFYGLCVLGISGIFYAFFRYRELQRLKQEKLRLRIARDLHDEMGSTLSSISILSEAALRHLQADIDRTRFGVIGARARQVMEAMSDIIWSVNPHNDAMTNVVQRMKEFAVEMLEPLGVNLKFEADDNIVEVYLSMERRKDFYLLFKEALNNAAKYSSARDIWVTLRVEDNMMSLEIGDDGIGFDPLQAPKGNGLKNMQVRAQHLGGQCFIQSSIGNGTTVLLSFSIA